MLYHSTRSVSHAVDSAQAVLEGLAPDGGLYMPESMPAFDWKAMAAKTEEKPVWVHFGAGNIFRGFIAVLQQRLLDEGLAKSGIVAAETFDYDIINKIPESEAAFALAKDGIEKRLRTDRTLDDGIAWAYISDENLGLAPAINADGTIAEGGVNLDKNTFEALPAIKLQDVIDFQKANVKGRTYRYGILGKIEDLDMEALSKIGKVVVLTTEDIFGY